MKAIILAAGRGSRMLSLTDNMPKSLVLLRGKPLIEHQINAFLKAGVREIIIITGYQSQYLEPWGDIRIYNPRWQNTNMVYSLMCAKDYLVKEDCLVSYSDIFFYSPIVLELINCKSRLAISYDPNWLDLWSRRFEFPLDDAETFKIDKNDWLIEIGHKTNKIEDINGQYMGLLKFKCEFWRNYLPKIHDNLQMTHFLSNLLELKFSIKAIKNCEPWGEIDSASDLKLMEKILS